MLAKSVRWLPLETEDLKKPQDHNEEDEEDVHFAIEEIDGDYEIVNNQIVFKAPFASLSSGEAKEVKKTKKQKKSKEKNVESVKPKETETEQKVEENEAAVEELPTADLPEWEPFNLHPYLLKGLESLGFMAPTPIQTLSLPAVLLHGKDVLGAAETGSGKTLAYGLPILSFLLSHPPDKNEGLPALIITPTRELAMQVTEHLRAVLKETPLTVRPRIEPIVGGIAEPKQERLLSRKPEVVVATMGRLQLWMRRHNYLSKLKETLRFLVLDEADRLSDKAHFSDLAPLVDLLTGIDDNEYEGKRDNKPKKRQTLLFSATLLNAEDEKLKMKEGEKAFKGKERPKIFGPFGLMAVLGLRGKPLVCNVAKASADGTEAVEILKPVDLEVMKTAKSTKREKEKVEEKVKKLAEEMVSDVKLPDSISFFRIDCTDDDKELFLHWILSTLPVGGSILVFVNTISATQRLSATISLSFPKWSISSLHANMEQKQRLRNLERFKGLKQGDQPSTRLLIASDVAARGLDISDVDTVIHFGIPSRLDTFIHRSGRCGRAGRSGTVVCLVSGLDQKNMGKIRSSIAPRTLEAYPVRELELKKMAARVRICKQLVRLQDDLQLDKKNRAWRKRTAKEADLEYDSDYDEGDEDDARATVTRTLARKERNQQIEQIQFEIAKLKRELNYILSGKLDAATHGGSHRRGRKRPKF